MSGPRISRWIRGAIPAMFAVAALLGVARAGSAQTAGVVARVEGRVIDTADTHVSGARVELVGVRETLTDTGGVYRFRDVPPGTYFLRVQRLGYAPAMQVATVQGGPVVRIDVEMVLITPELARITVTGEVARADPSGFNRRLGQHVGGYFITEAEITHRAPIATAELFRTVPYVHVSDAGVLTGGGGILSLGTATLESSPFAPRKPPTGQCTSMQIFVDGTHVSDGFNVNTVPPNSIRGIEVYAGPATTPSELRSFGTVCGTVAIWTK